MLELKELVEQKEFVPVERIQEIQKGEKLNQKIQELNMRMLFNPRYYEEKEKYLINLNVLKANYYYMRIY
ncbi:MAG: hypothetical protein ACFFA0_09360 [Promethearchaeota archaeon]